MHTRLAEVLPFRGGDDLVLDVADLSDAAKLEVGVPRWEACFDEVVRNPTVVAIKIRFPVVWDCAPLWV